MNAIYPKIILASSSPRRQELIRLLGFPFTIIVPNTDETFDEKEFPETIPVLLSRKKADAVSISLKHDEILVAADTLVFLNNQIIGKPENLPAAKEMLHKLSGRMHEVITGVTLRTASHEQTFAESSRVYFRSLSKEMIDFYVEKFRPLDKAGSYAIQEWIGLAAIERIEGCFYNVMGLPVNRLLKEMQKLNFEMVPLPGDY